MARFLEMRPPELVWTGPESARTVARDTAVVLRSLFEGARGRVVLAGYSFANAEGVLRPLHETMRAHGVDAAFFVDVAQPEGRQDDPEAYGRGGARGVYARELAVREPVSQALLRPPRPRPWTSVGQSPRQCVSVDGRRAFVSSANFTARGQDRNIETGVLLADPLFASQLERQWLGLISVGLVLEGGG